VLVELIAAVFIATYVLLVALGHVLLVIAIYRCLREDGIGGYRRRSPASSQMPTDDGKPQESASPLLNRPLRWCACQPGDRHE